MILDLFRASLASSVPSQDSFCDARRPLLNFGFCLLVYVILKYRDSFVWLLATTFVKEFFRFLC